MALLALAPPRRDQRRRPGFDKILSQDKATVFATVYLNPRHSPGEVGYEVEISYPAFTGTHEEVEEPMAVFEAFKRALPLILRTTLVKKGE